MDSLLFLVKSAGFKSGLGKAILKPQHKPDLAIPLPLLMSVWDQCPV